MRGKLKQDWLTYAVYDNGGKPIGMAILFPASDPISQVTGEGIYFFHCLDINKEQRKKGLGKMLLERITEDIQALGGKGIAVECFREYWMPPVSSPRWGLLRSVGCRTTISLLKSLLRTPK